MDVLILADKTEIEVDNGGSIARLFTTVKDFDGLKMLSENLEKPGNLKTISILSDRLASAKYENMTFDTTFKSVDVTETGIRVEISLRKMTEEEQKQEDVQKALEYLTDEQAVTVIDLYPEWSAAGQYYIGDRRVYKEVLYKCLQSHVAQADWAPDVAPSLWTKILAGQEETEIGAWEQPDSTNPYQKGDKVIHNGKIWESLIDNNVWEPGADGSESLWKESEENEEDGTGN